MTEPYQEANDTDSDSEEDEGEATNPGKFMMDQMVLRGACDFTPVQHSRITYRNFYPASSVWQMSGVRLAEDA